MARKSKTITVATEGRDKGKTFIISEMAAEATEEWCGRAITAIGRSRMDLPEEASSAPSAMLMAIGAVRAIASMNFDDAKPLIKEMMACVQIIPDPTKPQIVRDLLPDDTEEVATRLALRKEVIELHLGFTLADLQSRAAAWMQGMIDSMRIPTSPSSSEASSQAD